MHVRLASAESLRGIAVLLHAALPKATVELWRQVGAESALGPISEQRIADIGRWGQLPSGVTVTKGDSLFPRLDDPA